MFKPLPFPQKVCHADATADPERSGSDGELPLKHTRNQPGKSRTAKKGSGVKIRTRHLNWTNKGGVEIEREQSKGLLAVAVDHHPLRDGRKASL